MVTEVKLILTEGQLMLTEVKLILTEGQL